MVNEIKNIDDFTNAVTDSKTNLVIIDFYADWCVPCKAIAPAYIKMSEKYLNINFYKINADTPELSKVIDTCEISSLPTFCLFKNGNYITKVCGADIKAVESMITENLNASN